MRLREPVNGLRHLVEHSPSEASVLASRAPDSLEDLEGLVDVYQYPGTALVAAEGVC